jgi:FkbM family methyltransferase
LKIEQIIHFSVPAETNAIQEEVIERARELHPTWEVKVWRDPIKADGFLLEKYWRKVKTGAGLADLIRLDVLFRFGGVYVDSDIKLIRPLDVLAQHYDCFIASEDGVNLTNALVGARKQSPAIYRIIDYLNKNEPDWDLPPNIATGPVLFAAQLKWSHEITVLPRETFYSYSYTTTLDKDKLVHRHSYGEHLWHHSWKMADPKPSMPKPQTRIRLRNVAKERTREIIAGGFHVLNRLQRLNPAPKPFGPLSYPCSDELIVQTVHGFRMVVDGRDLSVTPDLVIEGSYEPSGENFVKSILRGGDWAIDVGANVGLFSLLAGQCVGPFGRVFSYEPNPRPAGLMAKSLVMNWMHERVVPRRVAVGNEPGTTTLTFLPEVLGGSQVTRPDLTRSAFQESIKAMGEERAQIVAVPCVRLDDEFPIDLPIRLLKIDVEGYEARVLAGADRLLKQRCIDYVMIELLEEVAGSMWADTLAQVKRVISYGYSVCLPNLQGRLIEYDLADVLRTGHRNIVLVAQEQYRTA